MNTAELRRLFLNYFSDKGHQIVPGSPVVVENDPTLLFTNAGMNQFKDCFLGAEKRPYVRATTAQKCIRISGKHNDLENVGVTARHHTFFEMLGNFSFGDYFKKEAINFAWEFVTEVVKLDKERIWVTIYKDDDEAADLWKSETDQPEGRIVRLGEKDNFWSMGDTGPCGPCSELHYYLGEDLSLQSEEDFLKDDGRYVEFWNLVFMQFDRSADGTLSPLPAPSVDTGMGLERITAIIQKKLSNYDTDILRGIIAVCESLSGFAYDGKRYDNRDLRSDVSYARDVAMRVIADHSRAVAFLIAEGVTPGSEGRGYVLRRLIRRAVRHGQILNFKGPFFKHTTAKVVELMGEYYTELREQKDFIARIADAEEKKFHETMEAGLSILQKEVEKLAEDEIFPGEVAFLLHDTYGFPLDLTEDALKAYSKQVDKPAFDRAMKEQKERSRGDRKAQGHVYTAQKIAADPTVFLGYEITESREKLQQVLRLEGNEADLLFTRTPFYAESGGQVADTGNVRFKDVLLKVQDVQKIQDSYYVHHCRIVEGTLTEAHTGETAELKVDEDRRALIRKNHSATHLLQSALKTVLGDHVKQAGSKVDDRGLRFDYSHFEALSGSELEDIQHYLNNEIIKNYEVLTAELSLDEAKARGATALFGEKYGERVRMVEIGPNSLELCGGTHVSRSGDIGMALVTSEGAISSGVRRIEVISGPAALSHVLKINRERQKIGELLKADPQELAPRVDKLLKKNRELEKEIETLNSRLASAASRDLVSEARTSPNGIKVITHRIDGADTGALRSMVDSLRVKLGSGVVALGSVQGEQAIIVAGVTGDLTSSLNAGALVKQAAEPAGGRGGGRADFAQAGGVDPSQLQLTLERLFELVA